MLCTSMRSSRQLYQKNRQKDRQNTNPEVFKYSSITEPKDTLECLHNGAPTAQDNPVKDTHLYREKRMRQRINTVEL